MFQLINNGRIKQKTINKLKKKDKILLVDKNMGKI